MAEPSSTLFLAAFATATVAALTLSRTLALARFLEVVDRIAARPASAIALCAATSLVGSMLVALLVVWPEPRVHDEFSYLLAADTFAHGRLTNPTHPLWEHFLTFHVFHEPSYASKFPPAQGAMLALGRLLTGTPLAGVWLSGAAMCAAICWMLYAFVTPRWALLGGIAATLQIGVATAWTQTYWGGAVAACAAALVLGAAVRLARDLDARHALVLGIGWVLLAFSRPFEGAITSLASALYLARTLPFRLPRVRTAIVTLTATLAVGALGMAAYNQAVVGRWWLPPYLHYEHTYATTPALAFGGTDHATGHRNDAMRKYYDGPSKTSTESAARFKSALNLKNLERVREFFLGRALLLPFLVGVVICARRRDGRLLLATLALGIAAMAASRYFKLHYFAPVAGALFACGAIGLERLDSWRPRGLLLGTSLSLAALATLAAGLALEIRRAPNIQTSYGYDDFAVRRAEVMSRLATSPGRDLVVVAYGPERSVHREWVYNAADIDAADIVWAHDMGAERNQELLDYYRDRQAWRLRIGFGKDTDGLREYAR